MTNLEKEKITSLRMNGESYSQIAEALGVSINTVKSFCRRNNIPNISFKDPSVGTVCRQCGATIKQTQGKKQKQYCSDRCRMNWWNAHPELMNRENSRTFICNNCGMKFDGYGKRQRKYCSRDCYTKSKAVK